MFTFFFTFCFSFYVTQQTIDLVLMFTNSDPPKAFKNTEFKPINFIYFPRVQSEIEHNEKKFSLLVALHARRLNLGHFK